VLPSTDVFICIYLSHSRAEHGHKPLQSTSFAQHAGHPQTYTLTGTYENCANGGCNVHCTQREI